MKRCDFCGGRFGLISHRHFWKRFCRKRCKDNYITARAQKIEASSREWCASIAEPSSGFVKSRHASH
jgi:hypothetical protein